MWPHIFGSFLGFHQEWRKVRSFSCQEIPCSLHGGLMHSLTLCCCRAIPKHYLEQPHMGRCPSEPGRAAITERMISGLRVTALSGREKGESFCKEQKNQHLPLQSRCSERQILTRQEHGNNLTSYPSYP